jgi:hypothetical protein
MCATGPKPKQSMQNWLIWTGIGELTNVGVFFFVWYSFNHVLPGATDILSILGLITLEFILLIGGLYWLLVRIRFFQTAPILTRLCLLKGLYGIAIFLMLIFPIGVIICSLIDENIKLPFSTAMERSDFMLGLFFYVFGVGEFLHYFIFKINMRRYERENSRRTHRFIPARLLRELRRAQNL